ncbi:MAG: thiosulfate oxidation carrier complex protein SoxZ [Methylococcales bacterium]|nr:thiosulfate oxidation carrier complex protein SoxZ [Methylococcales bacterium]
MSSIKIRTKRLEKTTQIRSLITHPMDNGRKKDKQGKLIPSHHIQELTVKHNNLQIIKCQMGGSISKNPYFDFLLQGGNIGDEITISWVDNLGKTDSKTHIIK